MSPKNKPVDVDIGEDFDEYVDYRKPSAGRSPLGPTQRSKRIRSARRPAAPNGIQRRRNKRVNW